MAKAMLKVRGIISIALFVMLAITLATGLEGEESEGNGIGEGNLHTISAGILGILALTHILLNYKMLVCQIRAILGVKRT